MQIADMSVTFGADPETFVGKGVPGSAIGKLGGTKHAPLKVAGGAVQEDNVLAEFNIDPADDEDQFVAGIQSVLRIVDTMLPDGLRVLPHVVSHEYTRDELKSFGRRAMEFGCDPDFNVYTESQNPRPSAANNLRTAGGHIHVGYDGPCEQANWIIGRCMDLYLGVPSVLMDTDTRRRTMYGGAGCVRHKPYGVEYRTLSNFWIWDEATIRWAFRQTVHAIERAVAGACESPGFTDGISWHDIQNTINTSNKAAAAAICEKLGIPVVYTIKE
jgi:hypothetical protein